MKQLSYATKAVETVRNNQYETLDQQMGHIMLREAIERLGVEIALAAWDTQAREQR